MRRARTVVRKPAVKQDRVIDVATLDHRARNRRQAVLKGEGGLEVELDLDMEATLKDGDALRLEDGQLVLVKAAPERLLEVRAENPLRLLRAAWQLGGRHASVEIGAEALYIEDDPALAELVRGQGCVATAVTRTFQPEREAHDHSDCGHDHGHGHHDHAHHGHDDDHHHGHDHAHGDHHHGHKHDH